MLEPMNILVMLKLLNSSYFNFVMTREKSYSINQLVDDTFAALVNTIVS